MSACRRGGLESRLASSIVVEGLNCDSREELRREMGRAGPGTAKPAKCPIIPPNTKALRVDDVVVVYVEAESARTEWSHRLIHHFIATLLPPFSRFQSSFQPVYSSVREFKYKFTLIIGTAWDI